jgi:hypothetical protein
VAITSVGYDGTVNETQWAQLIGEAGSRYGVAGAGDLKVTTLTGQDRTVTIAAGVAHGNGIYDTLSTAENVGPLPIVSSGTRWDTIVLRRNWSTNATTPMYLQGTAVQGIASGRVKNPGVQDDQPLALVQITAGQTLPTAIVDLRCWGGDGGVYAASDDALAYLDSPGTDVWINGIEYVREVASNGTVSWRSSRLGGAVWAVTISAATNAVRAMDPTITRNSGGFVRSGTWGVAVPKTAVYDLRLDIKVGPNGADTSPPSGRCFADVVINGSAAVTLRLNGYGEGEYSGTFAGLELVINDSILIQTMHTGTGTRTVTGTVKCMERPKPAW